MGLGRLGGGVPWPVSRLPARPPPSPQQAAAAAGLRGGGRGGDGSSPPSAGPLAGLWRGERDEAGKGRLKHKPTALFMSALNSKKENAQSQVGRLNVCVCGGCGRGGSRMRGFEGGGCVRV